MPRQGREWEEEDYPSQPLPSKPEWQTGEGDTSYGLGPDSIAPPPPPAPPPDNGGDLFGGEITSDLFAPHQYDPAVAPPGTPPKDPAQIAVPGATPMGENYNTYIDPEQEKKAKTYGRVAGLAAEQAIARPDIGIDRDRKLLDAYGALADKGNTDYASGLTQIASGQQRLSDTDAALAELIGSASATSTPQEQQAAMAKALMDRATGTTTSASGKLQADLASRLSGDQMDPSQKLQMDLAKSLSSDAGDPNQAKLASALLDRALGTGGPSTAEMQLRRGLADAQNAAASRAASMRGVSPALAARMALNQQTSMANQANEQAALLRAQEQMAAQGQAGGLLGQMRDQDLARLSTGGALAGQVGQSQLSKYGLAGNLGGQLAQQEQATQGLTSELLSNLEAQRQGRVGLGANIASTRGGLGAQQQSLGQALSQTGLGAAQSGLAGQTGIQKINSGYQQDQYLTGLQGMMGISNTLAGKPGGKTIWDYLFG